MRPLTLATVVPLLTACAGDCPAPTDLLEGQVQGTMDSAAWLAEGVGWTVASGALSINVDRTDGYTLSMVLRVASDSLLVEDLISSGEAPFEVPLGDGEDGNWINVYVQGATSTYSTIQGSGGTLTVAEIDGEVLLGCLDFGAATSDGESLLFEGGRFKVGPRD
ncbi:MAG: hypothetical protein ABIO70_35980 [Pseudomonadota bacterium]